MCIYIYTHGILWSMHVYIDTCAMLSTVIHIMSYREPQTQKSNGMVILSMVLWRNLKPNTVYCGVHLEWKNPLLKAAILPWSRIRQDLRCGALGLHHSGSGICTSDRADHLLRSEETSFWMRKSSCWALGTETAGCPVRVINTLVQHRFSIVFWRL